MASEDAARPAMQMELLEPGTSSLADVLRGPGRPKGVKNLRTAAIQRWFQATGKMPLEFLAGVYREETSVIAARLECNAIEALRVQVSAAQAVLPYVEQKLPIALEDVSDKPRPVFVVGELSGTQQQRIDGKLGLRVRSVQNQAVSVADGASSDVQSSDNAANALSEHSNPEKAT